MKKFPLLFAFYLPACTTSSPHPTKVCRKRCVKLTYELHGDEPDFNVNRWNTSRLDEQKLEIDRGDKIYSNRTVYVSNVHYSSDSTEYGWISCYCDDEGEIVNRDQYE